MSAVSPVVIFVVALIAVFVAWKVFSGAVKTLVLLGILALAALYVFGGGYA